MSTAAPRDDDALVLTWVPVVEDLVEASRLVPPRRRVVWLVRGAGALAVLTLAFAALVRDASLLLSAIPLLLMVTVFSGPSQRYLIGRVFRRNPLLREPTRVVVTPSTGLHVERPGFAGEYSWSRFRAVVEGERVFALLVHGQRGYHLLAKRGLADPADLPRLRAALHAGIGPAPRSPHAPRGTR